MTFSTTVAQQREKQAKSLKQVVMVCVAGSVALHGGGLFLKISDLWQADASVSEEITIVVTEDEPAPTIASEEPVSQPIATSEFSAPNVEPFSEPTVVDAPAPTTSEPTAEEPIAETPIPVEDPVTDESALDETVEDRPEEPSEAIAPSPTAPRDFSNLLAEMRRARLRTSPSMAAAPGSASRGESSTSGSENAGTTGSGVAAAPTQPGSGTAPESPAPSRQGSRSREITCRGCNFDYPDSADGAEGTAQVIVETDGQGRVVSVMLSRSSGNAALDRAALEQARRRVRLNNARAGESYPIDVDFVQPNSDAAERVRERGDRRSITVEDPESEVTETPETAPATATEPPIETPERPNESTPLEGLTPEPSVTPNDEPQAPAASTPATPEQSTEESSPPPEPVQPSPSPPPEPAAPVAPASAQPEPAAPQPPSEPPAQPEPANVAPDPVEP